jgi:multimeric flavodoxin WrbA
MRVAILDGDTGNGALSLYVGKLVETLHASGHDVKTFALRDLDIGYCTGCWSCWWATPGECIRKDDAAVISAAVVGSDFTLFASPIIMGFVSTVLKKTHDRLVPLILPYVKLIRGGSRHWKRYPKLPKFGLLLERGDADDEDVTNTIEMETALARDFQARMVFARLTTQPVKELADEIIGLERVAAR